MLVKQLKERKFEKELILTATKSSGPGGQNVNKVNTRVELRFNIPNSYCISNTEKAKLLSLVSTYLTKQGELVFSSQSERSQLQNKEKVIERFYRFLAEKLTPQKKRRATRPTRSSKEKRLSSKRILSESKSRRKKPEL